MAEQEKPLAGKESRDFIAILISVNIALAQIEEIKSELIEVKKWLEKTYWEKIS